MKNAMLIAAIGAALALSPAVLATGAAAASGHHAMMKKKKTPKSAPMQKAGTVGDKAAGGTNGPTDGNTSGAGK